MSILNGDTGIQILENFNVFLSNSRNPIQPDDAHGFLNISIYPQNQPPKQVQVIFQIETTFTPEHLSIFDEEKLAKLIAKKINQVIKINYFLLAKTIMRSISICSGYDNSFKEYVIRDDEQ